MAEELPAQRFARSAQAARRAEYLYVECCRVDQIDVSIELVDKGGRTLVPAEALDALLLVPGIAITQVAVKALAENDCSILWCGMEKVHSYAASLGCSSAS